MACAAFEPAAGYVAGLTAFVDCRVAELGEAGYLALAADGSPVRLALIGLVTILVALIGYRFMLGERLDMRDGALTAVRLGAVLALCTQWPAYQTLVYDVATNGPSELARSLSSAGVERSEELPSRIEGNYQALEALAHPRLLAPQAPPPQSGAAVPMLPALLGGALTIEEQKRLSSSSVVLLVASLGALLSVRVAAGLLLALGPLFAACLLFDGLRGWFEGWVRGLAGAMLGSVAATAVLSIELAVLEPQLIELAAALRGGPVRPGAATEIFATTLLFGVIAGVAMLMVIRAAAGFRLPSWSTVSAWGSQRPSESGGATAASATVHERLSAQQSRAQQLVEALRVTDQRAATDQASGASYQRLAIVGPQAQSEGAQAVPLGRTYRRTQTLAPSAAADRRNHMR